MCHLQMMSVAFSVGAISRPLPDGVQIRDESSHLKDIWYLRSSVVSCPAEWTELSCRHVCCAVRAGFIMCRSRYQVSFGQLKYMMWIICPELLVIPLWQGRNNAHLYMWPELLEGNSRHLELVLPFTQSAAAVVNRYRTCCWRFNPLFLLPKNLLFSFLSFHRDAR